MNKINILWLIRLLAIYFFIVTLNLFGQSEELNELKEIRSEGQIDTLYFEFKPIHVTAYPLNNTNLNVPLAVSTIGKMHFQYGQKQSALNEALQSVPGLFAMNADNFAQDLRISIRGFGARAPFGIRGIRILVDGIPETTPDGQAQVDNIDLGFISRAEVFRGSSSALFGNASGGMINLISELPSNESFYGAGLTSGQYGYQKVQVKAGNSIKNLSYMVHASHNQNIGYRNHSNMKSFILNGKAQLEIDPLSRIRFQFSIANSPTANDPGSLNIDQVKVDRRQAREANVQYQAGESVSQNRLSMVYEKQVTTQFHFEGNLHYTTREFANKLPFRSGGQVQLSRTFWGGRLMLLNSGNVLNIPYHLSFGVELGDQYDERRRFDNLEGIKGDKTFDQLEEFLNIGAFFQQEWIFSKSFRATFGIRSDMNKLKATDQYLNDGDGTGKRTMNNVNPLVGFVYNFTKKINLYGNYSTHFETPTLNELSNNPDSSFSGGFNPGLNPQYAKNVEMGLKGFFNENLFFEMAAFKIDALDEIIPFELPDLPGRTFYRNAGTSERKGFECGLKSRLSKGLQLSMAYTYSDFSYGEYQTKGGVFDGNFLPAIPKKLVYGELSYFHISGIYGIIQVQYIGDLFADDANTVKDDAYQLVHMRLGYKKNYSSLLIEPFIGLNNLLNTSYNSNIRMNAWGGRYFEPGLGFNIYGGVSIRFE